MMAGKISAVRLGRRESSLGSKLLWFSQTSTVRFFFFSSRRRHTRCSRDWSSDVCSSDLLHLENPRDAKTFKIIDANPAAASLTGTTLEALRGKTLADFPKLLKTPLPASCLDTLRAQEPRNFGEIAYGDERIREGIYAVQVFPLSHHFLGVLFEN